MLFLFFVILTFYLPPFFPFTLFLAQTPTKGKPNKENAAPDLSALSEEALQAILSQIPAGAAVSPRTLSRTIMQNLQRQSAAPQKVNALAKDIWLSMGFWCFKSHRIDLEIGTTLIVSFLTVIFFRSFFFFFFFSFLFFFFLDKEKHPTYFLCHSRKRRAMHPAARKSSPCLAQQQAPFPLRPCHLLESPISTRLSLHQQQQPHHRAQARCSLSTAPSLLLIPRRCWTRPCRWRARLRRRRARGHCLRRCVENTSLLLHTHTHTLSHIHTHTHTHTHTLSLSLNSLHIGFLISTTTKAAAGGGDIASIIQRGLEQKYKNAGLAEEWTNGTEWTAETATTMQWMCAFVLFCVV